MLANDDRRPERQAESDGVEAVPVAEGERHHRVRVVERTWRVRHFAQEADRRYELLVRVGHGRVLVAVAVAVLNHHRVPPVDLDVLGVRDVEDGLQASIAEDRVLNGDDVRVLDVAGPQSLAVGRDLLGVMADHARDDRASHLLAVVRGHRTRMVCEPCLGVLGDLCGRAVPQVDHEVPVDINRPGRQLAARGRRRGPLDVVVECPVEARKNAREVGAHAAPPISRARAVTPARVPEAAARSERSSDPSPNRRVSTAPSLNTDA